MLNDLDDFNTSSTFDSTKLQEKPCIQSQAGDVVVTMDTDMNTSMRDRLEPTRIPNNVEGFNFVQHSR